MTLKVMVHLKGGNVNWAAIEGSQASQWPLVAQSGRTSRVRITRIAQQYGAAKRPSERFSHFVDTRYFLASGGRGEAAKDRWPPGGANLRRFRAFDRMPSNCTHLQNGKSRAHSLIVTSA